MSTQYFGDPKFRKEWEYQIDTPVGQPCLLCGEAIAPGDTGTMRAGEATHHECALRLVIGSVGHLRGRCSCYGGNEEDPPGMTFRQAALAAANLHYACQFGHDGWPQHGESN